MRNIVRLLWKDGDATEHLMFICGMAMVAAALLTLGACKPLQNFIEAGGGTDLVSQVQVTPATQGLVATQPVVVPEPVYTPSPPVCEDIRWRYKIFTCDWVDTGRTYE